MPKHVDDAPTLENVEFTKQIVNSFSVVNGSRSAHRSEACAAGVNDPSAGSPTEALLRLVLPLSDKVY